MAVERRIVLPFRVRFDEATPQGTLRTSCHLRYAQDVAWVHSTSAGFGLAWYAERGRFWLVRHVELTVLGPAGHGDVVDVSTELVSMRHFWARRASEFRVGAGEPIARARVDWIMTTAAGRPVRVPDELYAGFPRPTEAGRPARLDLGNVPMGAIDHELTVRRHELDPMNHVNNAIYCDYLEEAIDKAGGGDLLTAFPRCYRLEYLASAQPGARMRALAWRDHAGWSCRLSAEGGEDLLQARVEA